MRTEKLTHDERAALLEPLIHFPQVGYKYLRLYFLASCLINKDVYEHNLIINSDYAYHAYLSCMLKNAYESK